MGSFDISCDRIRPINKMNPQVYQETELLTFSPIIGQPQRRPLIKKNHGYNKHSQLQRRSLTFLTLKYAFVVFVVASGVITLCDINQLKTDSITDDPGTNETHSTNETSSVTTPYTIGFINSSLITEIIPAVPLIVLPSNVTISSNYVSWVKHKMKIPLYVYMAVCLGVLFMAIFGRTIENFFIPFGFGMFMLLEIGIMIGLCIKETEFGLGYSSYLWTIYIFHALFSFAYAAIILMMHQLL